MTKIIKLLLIILAALVAVVLAKPRIYRDYNLAGKIVPCGVFFQVGRVQVTVAETWVGEYERNLGK